MAGSGCVGAHFRGCACERTGGTCRIFNRGSNLESAGPSSWKQRLYPQIGTDLNRDPLHPWGERLTLKEAVGTTDGTDDTDKQRLGLGSSGTCEVSARPGWKPSFRPRPTVNLEKAVGSTDCTDSTDLKQVGKGCRFTRRVKWKLRSGEASCPGPSVKSVKSVDNPTAAFRIKAPFEA